MWTAPDDPGSNWLSHDCKSLLRLWLGPSLVLVTPVAARFWFVVLDRYPVPRAKDASGGAAEQAKG